MRVMTVPHHEKKYRKATKILEPKQTCQILLLPDQILAQGYMRLRSDHETTGSQYL